MNTTATLHKPTSKVAWHQPSSGRKDVEELLMSRGFEGEDGNRKLQTMFADPSKLAVVAEFLGVIENELLSLVAERGHLAEVVFERPAELPAQQPVWDDNYLLLP